MSPDRLTLVEEERRSRKRYHHEDSSFTLACLDEWSDSDLRNVTAICLNSPHTAKIARRRGDLSSPRRPWRYIGDYPSRDSPSGVVTGELVADDLAVPAVWVSHYHAHALGAFWSSQFETADVLCLDGGGDFGEGAILQADDQGVVLRQRLLDVQLGSSYHHFSLRVYGAEHGFYESKVMAVAAYGQPELSESSFLSRRGTLVPIDEDVHPSVHDVAEFQERFVDRVLDLVKSIEPRAPALCLAGGCFYNVPLNARIADAGRYERVYVPPHAGDMGTALGAAIAGAFATGAELPPRSAFSSPYLGRDLVVTPTELAAIISAHGDVPVLHEVDDRYV